MPTMPPMSTTTSRVSHEPIDRPHLHATVNTPPEGLRTLLLAELIHVKHLVETAIGWVQALETAAQRRVPPPDAAALLAMRAPGEPPSTLPSTLTPPRTKRRSRVSKRQQRMAEKSRDVR
jgi:hypothetical protein